MAKGFLIFEMGRLIDDSSINSPDSAFAFKIVDGNSTEALAATVVFLINILLSITDIPNWFFKNGLVLDAP